MIHRFKKPTPEIFDNTYLNMELALPHDGGEVEFGCVVRRLRDKDGLPIGTAHDNHILDSRMCEVEFSDGHRVSSDRTLLKPVPFEANFKP
jgi:hypothetical protein